MIWVSNGDPPIYVWPGDGWYNQKDKTRYYAIPSLLRWETFAGELKVIYFPKKARIMTSIA
jgi:hypothetical protein